MTPKKTLHIVEDLRIGGLERVLASIVLNLNRGKFIPYVWCLARGGEIADDLIRAGIKVEILGMRSYYNPLKIIKLAGHLRKSKIDIIHTHGYFASTFGRFAAILAKTPVKITHIHTTYFSFRKRNILIEKFLSYYTNRIVCVSKSTQEFVGKIEGIDKKKTCLIYNGSEINNMDLEKAQISRTKFAFTDNDFVIITVASLVEHKGHKSLLKAVSILSKKYKNLRLLVVGGGPLESSLKEYAEYLEISSQVVFTGLKKNVFPFLKLADIFVLPSIEREGLGVALIEAMACGLPLIGSRLGGIPEVIKSNFNGLLVEPGNPYKLADAVQQIMTDKDKKKKWPYRENKYLKRNFQFKLC
jgi:glycosyltransferase involved in cell wall biosynthesis